MSETTISEAANARKREERIKGRREKLAQRTRREVMILNVLIRGQKPKS